MFDCFIDFFSVEFFFILFFYNSVYWHIYLIHQKKAAKKIEEELRIISNKKTAERNEMEEYL